MNSKQTNEKMLFTIFFCFFIEIFTELRNQRHREFNRQSWEKNGVDLNKIGRRKAWAKKSGVSNIVSPWLVFQEIEWSSRRREKKILTTRVFAPQGGIQTLILRALFCAASRSIRVKYASAVTGSLLRLLIVLIHTTAPVEKPAA